MLRQFENHEIEGFGQSQFLVLYDFVRPFFLLQNEIPNLISNAQPLKSNPHSAYDQVLPTTLIEKNLAPNLLKLYHCDEVKAVIKRITGWKDVFTLPLRTDGKFEINCKTNIYNSAQKSYLGWHFDQTFNFKGDQVILVLTLENTSAGNNLEY
jgi:hypothetical protein